MIKEILEITSNASNIKFLALFNAIFNINDFNYYLEKQFKIFKLNKMHS